MEVTKKTFQSQHCPLTPTNKAVFSELFSTKDGKVVKKIIYQTKCDWLMWKKSVTEEIAIQNKLSQACPDHILTIRDYTVEIVNHKRLLYITYDCDTNSKPLFQYILENDVPYREQINICEKLLQIAQILHHSEYCHGNLKPGNIIYWNKKVLITDFGSPRTHYWNFTKEHTGQKEKEWRNNFLYFCPQQYLEIMNEENIDFRDEQWRNLNLNDTKLRKKADLWALGIMMIQVLENNQNLSQDIEQFYGLNQQAILQKLQKLGETQCGLISNAVQSLIIDWLDPDQVLRQFQNQKMLINQRNDNFMTTETTSSFYQIFDTLKTELKLEPGIKQNQFFTKAEIERLKQQHDMDDKSSVRSDNTQLIENTKQIYHSEREGSIFKSQNLLVVDNGLTASQQLQRYQNQPVVFEATNTKTLYPSDMIGRTGTSKPSIKITSPQQQFPEPPWQVTNLRVIQDDEETQQFIDKSQSSQFEIPQDEQSQKLIQLTEQDTEKNKISYQPSSEKFQFNTSNQLQIITDKNDGGIVSFGAMQSQTIQFQKRNQEDSIQLQQINDEHKSGKIHQWNDEKKNFNAMQVNEIKEANDGISKEQTIGLGKAEQQRTTLQQPDTPQNLDSIDDEKAQVNDKKKFDQPPVNNLQETAKLEEQNKLENLDFIASKTSLISVVKIESDKVQLQQQKPPQKLEQLLDENQNIFQISDECFQENFSAYFPQTGNLEPLQEEQFDQNKQKQKSVINIYENDQNDKRLEVFEDKPNNPPPLSKIVPVLTDGPTLNELLKLNNLKNMNEEDLKTRKVTMKTVSEILNQVVDGIQPMLSVNDGKPDNNQVRSLIAQIKSLNPKQQQQTLIEVQEQLDAIKKKQKVDQIFNNNEIQKNSHLINLLSDDQLDELKNNLKSKKDPQSQALLDQILQLQKVNEKLQTASQKPSASNILKPDELAKLNAQQLTQYKEILTEIVKGTKSKPLQNQIFQQQQQIEKILDKVRLDNLLEKFIDNPKSDTLLPEKELRKLSEEQQLAYKEALQKLLPNAPGRFKKATQQALIALEKIMKPINQAPQLSQLIPIKQSDLSSEGTEPYNEKDFPPQQGQGNFEWNDKAFDFEVFSFNKIICTYQKTASLYNVQQEIPKQFKIVSENQQKRNKDFYKRNTYGGFWKDDQPHGIGTMMEAQKYGIYKGIFQQGKFMWGQVLELNDKGQLTQYIGYYHEKHQVKNAKKGEMIWYKYIQNEFQLIESYVGNFVLGYIQGNGSKTYADGSVYEGQWSKNKREGKGIYIRKTRGYYKYDGEFKNDFYHGLGIVYYDEMGKLTESGQYQNGRPIGRHELKLNKVLQKTINY